MAQRKADCCDSPAGPAVRGRQCKGPGLPCDRDHQLCNHSYCEAAETKVANPTERKLGLLPALPLLQLGRKLYGLQDLAQVSLMRMQHVMLAIRLELGRHRAATAQVRTVSALHRAGM